MISWQVVLADLFADTRVPFLIGVVEALVSRWLLFKNAYASNDRPNLDNGENEHYNHYDLERAATAAEEL